MDFGGLYRLGVTASWHQAVSAWCLFDNVSLQLKRCRFLVSPSHHLAQSPYKLNGGQRAERIEGALRGRHLQPAGRGAIGNLYKPLLARKAGPVIGSSRRRQADHDVRPRLVDRTEASNYALFKFPNTGETSQRRNTSQETYIDMMTRVELAGDSALPVYVIITLHDAHSRRTGSRTT